MAYLFFGIQFLYNFKTDNNPTFEDSSASFDILRWIITVPTSTSFHPNSLQCNQSPASANPAPSHGILFKNKNWDIPNFFVVYKKCYKDIQVQRINNKIVSKTVHLIAPNLEKASGHQRPIMSSLQTSSLATLFLELQHTHSLYQHIISKTLSRKIAVQFKSRLECNHCWPRHFCFSVNRHMLPLC